MGKRFYSNGKLLLTGEYAVLDGALSLAIPTRYGQSLYVTENTSGQLTWKSFDHQENVWFSMETALGSQPLESESLAPNNTEVTLKKILSAAQSRNPKFLDPSKGYTVETHLDFPREWGLGTSSTLINNIAQWAEVDAYDLLWESFMGSGYDIACAQHNRPILYQLVNQRPQVQELSFDPPFKDHLFFVYRNKKQNSREGIAQYRKADRNTVQLVHEVSEITKKLIHSKTLSDFNELLDKHENLLAETLGLTAIKGSLFPDFKGSVKSLGAWGGDFILATGNKDTPSYFKEKGYTTVLSYSEMVHSPAVA